MLRRSRTGLNGALGYMLFGLMMGHKNRYRDAGPASQKKTSSGLIEQSVDYIVIAGICGAGRRVNQRRCNKSSSPRLKSLKKIGDFILAS